MSLCFRYNIERVDIWLAEFTLYQVFILELYMFGYINNIYFLTMFDWFVKILKLYSFFFFWSHLKFYFWSNITHNQLFKNWFNLEYILIYTNTLIYTKYYWGFFPGGSEVKASACNAGDLGSIPGSGRYPREGNGNPLQYSCLENPMEEGAW